MNIKRQFLSYSLVIAASTLPTIAAAASAPTVLNGWTTENMFTVAPLDSGGTADTGMFTIDTVSSIATGSVDLSSDNGATQFDYSANWVINFGANTLTASGVTCNDLGGGIVDGCTTGFIGEGVTIPITNNLVVPGSFTVSWATGDAVNNVHTFSFLASAPGSTPTSAKPFDPNKVPATPFYSLVLTALGLSWLSARRLRKNRSKK